MKTYTVRIELQQEEDGRWSVWAADMPGCATWGDTREEALANIQEAAEGYIETLIKNNIPIPQGVIVSEQAPVIVTIEPSDAA